jgi:hypothetical protein
MRTITHTDLDGKLVTHVVQENIAQIWDIFIEENKLRVTPNHSEFTQFLKVLLKITGDIKF